MKEVVFHSPIMTPVFPGKAIPGWQRARRLLETGMEGGSRLRARLWPSPFGRPAVFLLNSFPKAGTNLLLKCAHLLGGHQHGIFLSRAGVQALRLRLMEQGDDGVLMGINHPCWVESREVDRILRRVWKGEFIAGHVPYSDAMVRLLQQHGFRALLILRDPRDVVVSNIHYLLSQRRHSWHEYYARALSSFEERLMTTICGVEAAKSPTGEALPNIGECLSSVLPWLEVGSCYTTRFELLVGPQGGGDETAQRQEVAKMAQHLGLSLSSAQIESVAYRLFGSSRTFRRGKVGTWREVFSKEHKKAIKRVAGQQLVQLAYERNLDW